MRIVERERELDMLRRSLAAARQSGSRMIAVAGPPGIGKTTLIGAVASELTEWTVLKAVCTPLGVEVPYGVLHQWFRALAQDTNAGYAPFDGPGNALRELLIGDPHNADSAALAYSVQWVAARLAEERPLLLVVDDLQWIDDASAAVLGVAVPQLNGDAVAVMFGVREIADSTRSPVVSGLLASAEAVTLGPLSVDGVAGLIADPSLDAARIHELSGGVPFYAVEAAASGGDLRASIRITESVTSRLDRLGVLHKAVAGAIAVLGPIATILAVVSVSEVDRETLDGVVGDLVAEGIVKADQIEPLMISHPLVEEAILGSMSSISRAELHDRAARVLAELGLPDTVVAANLMHGLLGRDPWKVRVFEHAAKAALAAGSTREAAAWLERALQESRVDDPGRTALLELAGRAQLAIGDRERAERRWREALRSVVDPDHRARLLTGIGDSLVASGRHADAEASYTDAAAELTTDQPLYRSIIARLLAAQLNQTMNPSALDLPVIADVVGQDPALDTDEDSSLLAAVAVAVTMAGDPGAHAELLSKRAYDGWSRDRQGSANDPTTYMLSGALNFTERFGEGVDVLTGVIQDARRDGQVLGEATALYSRGAMYLSAGDVRNAVADLMTAVKAVELGWTLYREAAEFFLIRCELLVGDLEAAGALALGEDYESPSSLFEAVKLVGKAHYWIAYGQPQRGLELARRAGSLVPVGGEPLSAGWRGAATEALLAMGDRAAAEAVAREEFELTAAASGGVRAGAALRLAKTVDDPAEAEQIVRDALDWLNPTRLLERAQLIDFLAELLVARDARDEAAGLLGDVLVYAQAQGMAPTEKRVRATLAAIGRPAIPTEVELRVSSLTPAEFRVASLAAQGLTNRDIAARLFVTMKTVEFHLSRCFRKLAVATRGELADVLVRVDEFVG